MSGLQAVSLQLLKEMLFTLDMAQLVGLPSDRQASDRLQRRCNLCPARTIPI